MKRSQPKRDWTQATEKLEVEEFRCRVCGSTLHIERAHIVGREHDRKPALRSDPVAEMKRSVWTVHPDRIVPLCGPATETRSCHCRYDSHELDLMPHLDVYEQAQAVIDCGGIELARRRLCPSQYRRQAA